MGLSSLRRHRGDYFDRQLVASEPSKEQLAAALEAEKAKTAVLQAALDAQTKATVQPVEPVGPLPDVPTEPELLPVVDVSDPTKPSKPTHARR